MNQNRMFIFATMVPRHAIVYHLKKLNETVTGHLTTKAMKFDRLVFFLFRTIPIA